MLGANAQAVQDWFRLYGYTAPSTVASLASDDTMTSTARHLFYVNRPVITAGPEFKAKCPLGNEKTVVLGCYLGNDGGIYLYEVTDSRLQGVEQVTAAHEMLHAAYRRLSSSERTKIDAQLNDFYQHGLTDQRIKDTIDAYRKSEPKDIINEMHSIFGTEVPKLPVSLEQYYARYFSDRSKVTAYTAGYQEEFTSRQVLIKHYDVQLGGLKQQIDANQAQLNQMKSALEAQNRQLQSERANDQVSAYNAGVSSYNAAVSTYNSLLADTKNLISQYNDIVDKRNAIVVEEQQLTQALSAGSLGN